MAALINASLMIETKHVYEVRPRTDRPGVALVSDVLAFRSAVVCRTQFGQQCYRIRAALQLFASCRDSRV